MVGKASMSFIFCLVLLPVLSNARRHVSVQKVQHQPIKVEPSIQLETAAAQGPTEAPQETVWMKIFKQLRVPLFALTLGIAAYGGAKIRGTAALKTVGILLIYFGYQGTMNLAMKSIFNFVPAPFFVTGMQQFIALALFLSIIFGSRLSSQPYQPRPLSGRKDYIAVIAFSLAFCLNIGLNNFSMSLVPMSLNLVLRSCLPLATYLFTVLLGPLLSISGRRNTAGEVSFMVLGVACAILTVSASLKPDTKASGEDSWLLMIGIFAAMGSLCSAAVNMVLASMLGNMKMNPLDTSGYMALPAGLIFLLPIFAMPHPLSQSTLSAYTHGDAVTDAWVVSETFKVAPSALMLVLAVGPVAFMYNILQWKLVQTLSATTTTFAGNFNKAASIVIALLTGLDTLPDGYFEAPLSPAQLGWLAPTRSFVYKAAVAGNILAFTAYSLLQEYNKMQAKAEEQASTEVPNQETDENTQPTTSFLDKPNEAKHSIANSASFLDSFEQQLCGLDDDDDKN